MSEDPRSCDFPTESLRILPGMADRAGAESEAEIARLLAACARQDRTAFQRLYERSSPQLLGILMRILKRRALAEDALQEVFVQVWRRAGEFQRERGSSWAWLIAITRYRAIDLQRRERRLAGGGPDGIEDVADEREPLEDLISLGRRAADALDRCVAALQPQQRDCILLSYQVGLTHSEVAARIGEPLGSIKSWIRRGLAALRRCLES